MALQTEREKQPQSALSWKEQISRRPAGELEMMKQPEFLCEI